MSERRRLVEGRPIATGLRRVAYLLWALLLMVCVTVVGAIQIQGNEVNRLTLAVGPAFDANGQVLLSMVDAETGLRGFQISHDPLLLTPYADARARTMAALTTLGEKLLLSALDDDESAQHSRLGQAQRLAVQQWWVYAESTKQAASRGAGTEVREGKVLFDSFRGANRALGLHITAERDHLRTAARRASMVGTAVTLVVTLVALVVALILVRRAAHSLSKPMTELRDTMTRQREGDRSARARVDDGALEVRSLAQDFNALTDQNLDLQEIQDRRLSMNKLTFEIARAIRGVPDTQEALDVLCVALGNRLGLDRVVAKTNAGDSRQFFSQWHHAALSPLPKAPGDVALEISSPAAESWQSIEHLAMDDFLAPRLQTEEQNRIFHQETGAQSVMVAPIGSGDRTIGVIYAMTVTHARTWTEPEANALQQVAGFVARAIVEADDRSQQRDYVEQLERLDRQKTDFLSTVSHELRTPLTSISGYLEMLRDRDGGDLTVEQARMLEVMDRNTSRLGGLIEDLLVLNRIESGHHRVDVEGVSMRELVLHAVHELSPFAARGGVELDVDAGPAGAFVRGDKGSLERAVINILSNAIKFSHPGGRVSIRSRLLAGERRILVSCVDRGIGIPEQDQSHLFTRFFRASNATAQAIPGTGLGLSIVKQIVEDHEGELRLSSIEGEGTEVVLDLPWSELVTSTTSGGNDSQSGGVFGIRA